MKTSGACLAALLLLLAVGVSLGRELLNDPVYVIDPWGPLKYPPVTVAPFTSVVFKWTGPHGVYSIPSGECPMAFTPNPTSGIVEMHGISDGGYYSTQPLAPGTYWYTSPVPGHCHSGALVNVVVAPVIG